MSSTPTSSDDDDYGGGDILRIKDPTARLQALEEAERARRREAKRQAAATESRLQLKRLHDYAESVGQSGLFQRLLNFELSEGEMMKLLASAAHDAEKRRQL